ncbi:MAG: DUF4013 domain-containing protein [Methanoregula sp.]|jgi:hypothetical protein
MDYGALISESVEYTREALAGKWTRWLVFILCSLPGALIQFTFDPEKLRAAKPTDWQDMLSLIPWPQIILLILAGFLLSFIVSGYIVRVYRGAPTPPGFEEPGSLYLDGIRLMIVDILWSIPLILVFAAMLALIFLAFTAGKESLFLALGATLILLAVAVVLTIVTILYSILGSVRFARTGSIREGIRFSAITPLIRTIGWGAYIIALIILLVIEIIFSFAVGMFAIIPFMGWLFPLALGPLFVVFSARFISLVYDHGVTQVRDTDQVP